VRKTHTAANRVVAYTRVSDPSQVEGYSLDAQKADIIRWCQRRNYELVGTYVEDGKSARSERGEKRPRIMALLEHAKTKPFDIVVVHTIDRCSRNVGVQRQALQLLGDAGIGFASVMEDFDFTTPGQADADHDGWRGRVFFGPTGSPRFQGSALPGQYWTAGG